ncbi:MAG: GTP-binding protein [Phycisphaerae bacterium]|nr:GTP-binding protein [Phycisphaerae bacterium]MDD5380521.1 GTP-binding protein [Phycisphaerae bacterium]
MYAIGDTIVAISSSPLGERAIVRISGPDAIKKTNQIFRPTVSSTAQHLTAGSVTIDDELEIDATLYLFFSPYSYTGETVAEIHLYTNSSITGALVEGLLNKGLRMAGPGEFTARAYLNGKIDLAQAEAVNEIIVSSNRFQLAAAEKLLGGRLAETTEKIRSALLDCLTFIEAGLDFSGEDIELDAGEEAIQKLSAAKSELEQLLAGSITCESTLDLPSVGIAGAPNAGKSSLLNKLTGCERSIVSAHRKTTRDVLTSMLTLKHCRCVMFDCAGLVPAAGNILDELAQAAAIEALRNSSAAVFCVDVSKADWAEDVSIRKLISPKVLIPVATKCDLFSKEMVANRIAGLNQLFNAEFLPTSTETGIGMEQLRNTIDKKLIEQALGDNCEKVSGVALTARHKQAVTEAIENVGESINELNAGNDEVAAMLLRAAYQNISDIEQQHVDEEILDRIFSRFCIGK